MGRLKEVALIDPDLYVCEYSSPAARAFPAMEGLPNGGIQISTGMMRVIGGNESMAASLLGHEIAHILEEHGALKSRFRSAAAAAANRAGRDAERAQVGAGPIVTQQVFVVAQRAYSRELERRADDIGYRLYRSAGYDPRESTRLMEAMRELQSGDEVPAYLSTHPGMDERIVRTLAIARDDSARADAADRSRAIEKESAAFQVVVDDHIRNGKWREASGVVADWLKALPDSGLGWYYRGQLMRKSVKGRTVAWRDFAKAAELDPNRAEIWSALVESLVIAGYRQEAAACVAAMSDIGHSTAELREGLFEGRLFVHRSRSAPYNLWWSRERSGSRFITNDRALFELRGMRAQGIPPEWKPPE
ncbi:MAG: M48 family metalloprotease [Betaproteobacteria bacterium]